MSEQRLTPEQVATRLQVTEQSVYSWLRSGKLRGSKIGRLWRVNPRDLEHFVRERRNGASWEERFQAVLSSIREGIPPEIPDPEIEADVTRACEAVRAELYARRR